MEKKLEATIDFGHSRLKGLEDGKQHGYLNHIRI